QQRGPIARTRRHPRGDARRNGAHRRALPARGHSDRCAHHPDTHPDDLLARRTARGEPRGQGRAGVRGDAAAIGGVPWRRGTRRPWRECCMSRRLLPLSITVLLFLAMAAFGAIRYDGFLSPQVFLNLLIDNAFLCIVAVGMTFVILSGGIDLSVGSVVALTTMLTAALVERQHLSPALVLPLVLALGAAFGAVQGVLI